MTEIEMLKSAIRDLCGVVGRIVVDRGQVAHVALDLRKTLSRIVDSLDQSASPKERSAR